MTVLQGDCLDAMPTLDADSVDVVVTDPPYGLDFMGKGWDHGVPGVPFWTAAIRVAKPGAHLVAFGGTRTHHRLMCALEDAGWEIRDCLMWLYGTGFPKSLDVSKALDKAAGAERKVIGIRAGAGMSKTVGSAGTFRDDNWVPQGPDLPVTAPTTDAAQKWSGWGTALKPAWEPIILARKPLVGTVAANVQEHGTGAINIDASRIGSESTLRPTNTHGVLQYQGQNHRPSHDVPIGKQTFGSSAGRWPANLVLDKEAGALLDAQSGESKSNQGQPRASKEPGEGWGMTATGTEYSDKGGASRFFYCAKASRAERGEGNNHPTVKPLALMRWLVKLVTPPDGLVLDPFVGSGTTGVAAKAEGFRFLGIEQDANYVAIATARIAA